MSDDKLVERRKKSGSTGSSLTDNTTLLHVGAEVLVGGAVAVYLYQQIQALAKKVDPVHSDNINLASYVNVMERGHADALKQQALAIGQLQQVVEDLKKENTVLKAEITNTRVELGKLTTHVT